MTSGRRVEVPGWIGIALVVTPVPDVDLFLPWFTHRGVTHSLLAAICLGVVVAVVVTTIWWRSDPLPSETAVKRALLGFVVGAGSIVSHLIGDVITPMGVRPFFPIDSVYTLNLVYAKDVGANLSFVVVGIVVCWTAYRRSNDPVPTDGSAPSELATDSDVSFFNS